MTGAQVALVLLAVLCSGAAGFFAGYGVMRLRVTAVQQQLEADVVVVQALAEQDLGPQDWKGPVVSAEAVLEVLDRTRRRLP